jgi:hypothetical protein
MERLSAPPRGVKNHPSGPDGHRRPLLVTVLLLILLFAATACGQAPCRVDSRANGRDAVPPGTGVGQPTAKLGAAPHTTTKAPRTKANRRTPTPRRASPTNRRGQRTPGPTAVAPGSSPRGGPLLPGSVVVLLLVCLGIVALIRLLNAAAIWIQNMLAALTRLLGGILVAAVAVAILWVLI